MNYSLLMTSAMALILAACSAAETSAPAKDEVNVKEDANVKAGAVPADYFDLSHWNITVPVDVNNDKKVDTVKIADIQSYNHPDFFYVNADGHIVFAAPNKALTTANSSNTRSELRYMSRGRNTKIKTAAPGNNFALRAHSDADSFEG